MAAADGDENPARLTPQQATEVEKLIQALFTKVLEAADKIVTADGHFGYLNIEKKIHPRIEDILLGLRLFENIFDAVHDSPLFRDEFDIKSACLSGKQSVWRIKMLHSALQCENKEAYDEAIHALKHRPGS